MLLRTVVPEHINGYKHYVYAHFLLENEYPFYIGIGTSNNKYKYGRANTKTGRNKYWRNITKNKDYICIICSDSSDYEKIKEQEKELISIFGKRIDDDSGVLVNITDGGDGWLGCKHTPEHIQKLRERYTGKNNPMYGKIASPETRLKMSISSKGRHHKESTKELLRIKKLERGYQGKYGKEHNGSRIVYKVDPITYDIIKIFYTVFEAAEEIGASSQCIGKACKQLFKVHGYNWCYKEDYSKELFIKDKKIYKKDKYKIDVCKDFKSGLSKASIARKYNIGETTCSRILNNNKELWQ